MFVIAFWINFELEYEPFDEALRQKADGLQNDIQSGMVRVTKMRREIPEQVDGLVAEGVRILTNITEQASILEPEDINSNKSLGELGNSSFRLQAEFM